MAVFDVIIIGAGAAGLMAANEVSASGRTVCILEARDRVGGRIHTISDPRFSFPVELGAEFIHGKLDMTFELLEQAGLDHLPVRGNVYQVRKGKWHKENDFIQRMNELEATLGRLADDMPLERFLRHYFSGKKNTAFRDAVKRYAEGYDAADPSRLSTLAFKDELANQDDNNYRLANGYQSLISYLEQQCLQQGTVIKLNSVVTHVDWRNDTIEVEADDSRLKCRQVIITVPVGVWQARKNSKGSINYTPSLEEKAKAARQLGFGSVIKIILQFQHPFWNERGDDIGFILSDAVIPTWWTQQPAGPGMLAGWIAGPAAKDLRQSSNKDILQKAMDSLAAIFKDSAGSIERELQAAHVYNWIRDPFSRGAYSYPAAGAEQFRRILAAPVDRKLFFAGEALYEGSEAGTVEAALNTGKDAALKAMARDF